jgi:hypothetical protein
VDGPATETADDLLLEADVAMYRAKAGGKDRVLLFSPSSGSPLSPSGATAPASPARALEPHSA